MRGYMTFVRCGGMPRCAKCRTQLDHWIIGMKEEDYRCDDCRAKEVDEIVNHLREALKQIQEARR